MADNTETTGGSTDPYQDQNASFDGAAVKPEQTEEQVAKTFDITEYLRDVIDPELGINIVDLGLVYDVWLDDIDGKNTCVINMTLTSPACPLTDVIGEQIEDVIVGNKLAEAVQLNWVWMPPWGPNMITEEGREMLQALGFAV